MPIAIEKRQHANSSSLRRLVARRPVTAFLIMAFAFGWSAMLPLLLSESGFGVLPFALRWQPFASVMSVFGLALPAFLVTAATGGKAGVRDLLSRSVRWRVGAHWYLIALFGLLVVTLLAAVPFLGAVPLEAFAQKWGLLFTVFLPGVLIPFVLVNLWEELGWTGFMQHTLQDRHGLLLAGVMVAPAFALIHLPGFFAAGFINDEPTPLGQFPAVLLQVGVVAVFAAFLRVLIMWLYNGSGRSVLIVALFHSAFNMINGQKITPELLLLPDAPASLIPGAAVAVFAVLLVVFTRGRLSYEPERREPRSDLPTEGGRKEAPYKKDVSKQGCSYKVDGQKPVGNGGKGLHDANNSNAIPHVDDELPPAEVLRLGLRVHLVLLWPAVARRAGRSPHAAGASGIGHLRPVGGRRGAHRAGGRKSGLALPSGQGCALARGTYLVRHCLAGAARAHAGRDRAACTPGRAAAGLRGSCQGAPYRAVGIRIHAGLRRARRGGGLAPFFPA